MDVGRARTLLNVSDGASPDQLRAAHRRAIRRAHPDAGGTTRAAAEVNEALAVLLDPPPAPPPPVQPRSRRTAAPAPPPPDDVTVGADEVFVVRDRPDALLLRLADAGHEVGEVVFVDPHDGLLEIVVGDAPAVGQLAVSVGHETADGTPVSFTLEPLGVTPAPPIGDVVDALMRALRR
ncbi:MAG: hypothetical protein AAF548_06365 [Actinomycetota bacterium]